MNFENFSPESQDPRAVIEALRQQIKSSGADDSEDTALGLIISDFEKGNISGEEAISKAEAIKASRQDDH